jgi:predicted MFS family arabinose efflux permease
LQYFGTLVAPLFGMAGDRLGHRAVLCAMRASYAVLATTLMLLAFADVLRPYMVFIMAAIGGLVRPADLAMRGALVAETMPPDRFVSAMGASRTTSDTARTIGSLAGAGLFAALGLGPAYVAITSFYAAGLLLTFGVGNPRNAIQLAARSSLWRDLGEGLAYLWDTPSSLAALLLAFLVNLTAFPMTSGLLPYVARDIYHVDQTGLGYLIASFAFGSLLGSILISVIGRRVRPARMMIVFAIGWYAMLLAFVRMPDPTSGCLTLMCAGVSQSLCLVPMSAMLLHGAGAYRGRVMGMRMLAIYGLPLGLMGAGALIDRIGFVATATGYCVVGVVLTLLIALRWRDALWPLHATANAR